jgi:hypothetical protein
MMTDLKRGLMNSRITWDWMLTSLRKASLFIVIWIPIMTVFQGIQTEKTMIMTQMSGLVILR